MNSLMHHKQLRPAGCRRHKGVALVEFALVAIIFFTLLIGIMEFGRWLFTLNAANEATRLGARLAVVCSNSASDQVKIKNKMHQMVSGISTTNMSIVYAPDRCDASTCKTVTVRLNGATFSPLIPLMGGNYSIPGFATSLPRELMSSAGNPVCP